MNDINIKNKYIPFIFLINKYFILKIILINF